MAVIMLGVVGVLSSVPMSARRHRAGSAPLSCPVPVRLFGVAAGSPTIFDVSCESARDRLGIRSKRATGDFGEGPRLFDG